ncbi:hypothetical protein B0T17DRAFT_508827 [Bombardia bombarda]|uniref:Uncharacterized protein n=1 Tax=Bombardia bombarda TaxID=252184 RepID=A0AA39WTV5_9PEZI|nr:hypothetical protein B0T17DRAFT_508827 [Bombardia bombarda]
MALDGRYANSSASSDICLRVSEGCRNDIEMPANDKTNRSHHAHLVELRAYTRWVGGLVGCHLLPPSLGPSSLGPSTLPTHIAHPHCPSLPGGHHRQMQFYFNWVWWVCESKGDSVLHLLLVERKKQRAYVVCGVVEAEAETTLWFKDAKPPPMKRDTR